MINVYSKDTTVFNNNGLATLLPLSCELSTSINGAWTLKLEHSFFEDGRERYLVEGNIIRLRGVDCIREWESTDQRFRIAKSKKTLTSMTAVAFPMGMEAQYDAPIQYLFAGEKTGVQAAALLDNYIKTVDSNNKYTLVSNIADGPYWSEWINTNLITAISGADDLSFVNVWGGEVVYDNFKISILQKIGEQDPLKAYPIKYGRNLTGLSYEVDTSNVVTRFYPISKEGIRLNTWADVTDQGGNPYVDTQRPGLNYPFVRISFIELDHPLVETDVNKHDYMSILTEQWRVAITNAMTATATTLWNTAKNDLTNTYCADFLKSLISGEGGISEYLQNKFVFTVKSWQSFVKACAKNSVAWIKNEDLPEWEWHKDTSVTPHAWWYGDDSVTPAVSYAKNCYVKIGKYWEYFNDDGYWLDYRRIPDADMEVHESQTERNSNKWFGSQKRYYAHNEYVYVTVEGQMKEWWYDSDGWYDEASSGDSDFGWHQDSYGWWFGEEDAGTEDKNKYLHDCWRYIDGNYYWFDQYGYANSEDPDLYKQNYEWGDLVDDNSGKHWFGNPDKNFGVDEFQTCLKSQWAEINREWYYFDSNGYVVDMDAKASETIAWFANGIYDANINTIKGYLTAAYEELFDFMTGQCEYYFEEGADLPTVNVTVDLIDLSKTTEYASYSGLERICLGDQVIVEGPDGSTYAERVVGLTYDCILGYNTKVEVGELSKSVSQVISSSFKGTGDGTKLIAGDNITINTTTTGAQVITVAEYVGHAIGLQDFLLNGSTCVSGNVGMLNIAAGEKISISRSGHTITINSTGGDGDVNLYHGISVPDANLGENNDIYVQLKIQKGSNISLNLNNQYGGVITGYSATANADSSWNASIVGRDNWEYHTYVMWRAENLEVGKEYTVTFGWETLETPSLYGMGELFGITIQHNNRCIDMRNYSSELVEDGAFKYFANQERYGEFWYQSFHNSSAYHNYEFTFTAKQTTEYIGYYLDRISGGLTTYLRQFGIGLSVVTNEIKDIYYKLDGAWIKDERGIYEPFIGATSQADGEDGLVPQPLIADKDKFLKGDGTWAIPNTDFTGATSQADGTHGLVPAPTISDVGKVLGADGSWVEQSGGIEFVVLNSPTEYNNLTPAQKMDVHKAYVVKNWATTGGLPLYVNNDGELS